MTNLTMQLPNTQHDLDGILIYLIAKRGLPPECQAITAKYSQEEDARNLQNPRGFCHTEQGKPEIFCSRALEDTDREVRVGILLHEIGHIMLNAFDGDESEVDVDEWVTQMTPKGAYRYFQDYTYQNSLYGEPVTAHSVQMVTRNFLKEL